MSSYLYRLQRLNHLIKLECTGPPAQLARKLEISERQLYHDINLLKELGGPIVFDKPVNSYVYSTPGEILLGFLPEKSSSALN